MASSLPHMMGAKRNPDSAEVIESLDRERRFATFLEASREGCRGRNGPAARNSKRNVKRDRANAAPLVETCFLVYAAAFFLAAALIGLGTFFGFL